MRASRDVISAWWADVSVTFYGSTRKAQLWSLRKKISEQKNYQAHKEAINILEISKKDVLKTRAVDWKTICSLCAFTIAKLEYSKSEVTNMRPAGRMRPAKEFLAARDAFRRDWQPWTFFDPLLIFAMRYFVFNRFHSMTKKLCGPLAQR